MGFMIFRNYQKIQEEKMKLIAKYSSGRVLDVGGSQNPNKFFDLNDSVREVWLLDLQKPDRYQRKYKKFIRFDLNKITEKNLPFKDEFFDTVILADVLEHICHPLALLPDVNRILKKNKTLIISLPSSRYYLEIVSNLIFSKPTGFPEHKILFTRSTMKYFLEFYGFKIEKMLGYSFWIPFFKIGFVNTKWKLPELITWQQIYICKKIKA